MKKIILISSSGGHFEQLIMLKSLAENNKLTIITEKTRYKSDADYFMLQTGLKDFLFPFKMMIIALKSLYLLIRIRPNYIITTGTMICIPMCFLGKLFRKRIIYIETFARVTDGSKTGKLIYKIADLFIVQWEELLKIYPKAIYGGGIY